METKNKKLRLGDKLIASGLITEDHLRLGIRKQKKEGIFLGQALIKLGFVEESKITDILSVDSSVQYFDISNVVLDLDIVNLVPFSVAKKHKLIAFDVDEFFVSVVMADPLDIMAIDEVWKVTNKKVKTFAASGFDIMTAINDNYSQQESLDDIVDIIMEKESLSDIDEESVGAPIVRLLDHLIVNAVKNNATDIHINPTEKLLKIKMRIDGDLERVALLQNAVVNPLISRIKIVSGLDPSERRRPQDGRFTINVGTHNIEVRVSILNSTFGENAVLRILDKERMEMNLDGIGMPEDIRVKIRSEINNPHGMILVTGPTGSGKTTTLYSMINEMDRSKRNIFTIEDPVEFIQDGIQQVSVNQDIGLSFSGILRSILRQDPDIVMMGEIRDKETVDIAFRAAMTGHLLLSTLHTNSAIETVFRLLDMDIDSYLIPSVVNGILAQRLVRKLCKNCKVKADKDYNDTMINKFGLNGSYEFYHHGDGCDQCRGTGYLGRAAIYEFLKIDQSYSSIINNDKSLNSLKEKAYEKGFKNMFHYGAELASSGTVALEDVLRVTNHA